ncbi:Fur family transcriptional regulator [Thiomonas sp.]|jgi:Fur family zinc uptake transcriptional regulator|uniref:Fur family transcriptional regulator n=1 Tax=Thiomonas sp. TaxID=2047785 RepID=UPI002631870E|nr:Fur family transcriptional regulator [Thiomonas sp.]
MTRVSVPTIDDGRPRTDALLHAERLCAARGVRLTPLRRRVLELVQARTEAVKAYDLLAQLSTEDHAAKPPTVYRALDFLLEQGLIHRVDSLNAFVSCDHPGSPHAAHLLLCTRCGRVEELHDAELDAVIARAATTGGFRPSRARLEVQGLCAACAAQEAPLKPRA